MCRRQAKTDDISPAAAKIRFGEIYIISKILCRTRFALYLCEYHIHTSWLVSTGVRSNGDIKYRAIDDFSRSGVNECTLPTEKLKCDTIDNLYKALRLSASKIKVPVIVFRMSHTFVSFCYLQGPLSLWKADIASAFRIVPVSAQHREYAAVVFLVKGVPHVSVHY